jgi:hypothetical protein
MPVLVAAVMTMSAAQLLDLVTFNVMVRHVGVAAEANPLVGMLFGLYGYPIVAIVKVVLLAFVTSIAAILIAQMRPRLAGAVVTAGIAVGLIGGISNSIALGLL